MLEPHGAAGVELLGAHGHLGPQPKLAAIVEARGGVHKDRRRIHFIHELHGVLPVVCQDTVGVLQTVLLDMVDCLLQSIHDPYAQNQRKPLRVKVVGAGGQHMRLARCILEHRVGIRVGAQFHLLLGQARRHGRQEARGHGAMHQHCVQRIAGAGALRFGIDDDVDGAVHVGARVHKEVADAHAAGNDGDGGLLAAELVQRRTAAGNDHVDIRIKAQKLRHQRTVAAGNVLDGVNGKPHVLERAAYHIHQRPARAQRVAATAQDDGVARFDAQHGDVDGHIGA